jgi:hypothetical protein
MVGDAARCVCRHTHMRARTHTHTQTHVLSLARSAEYMSEDEAQAVPDL